MFSLLASLLADAIGQDLVEETIGLESDTPERDAAQARLAAHAPTVRAARDARVEDELEDWYD